MIPPLSRAFLATTKSQRSQEKGRLRIELRWGMRRKFRRPLEKR
jgi:hypothetical protein